MQKPVHFERVFVFLYPMKGLSVISILIHFSIFGQMQSLYEYEDFNQMKLNFQKTDTTKYRPLVVVLHGCSQWPTELANHGKWSSYAQQDSFHLLMPEQNVINNVSKCFNWFDKEKAYKEMLVIEKMIGLIQKDFKIDTQRVFLVGYSAGAFLAIQLQQRKPVFFNGVVSYAGGPFMKDYKLKYLNQLKPLNPLEKTNECDTNNLKMRVSRTTNLFIYHGENDFVSKLKNSENLFQQWICSGDQRNWQIEKDYITENNKIICYAAKNTETNQTLKFYKMANIGHQISTDYSLKSIYIKNIGFSSTHQILQDFGIIP